MTHSNRRALIATAAPGPLDDVLREVVLTDDERRLIAAAPKMLAALEAVMAEWRDGYGLRCKKQVCTAIAEATGEQP